MEYLNEHLFYGQAGNAALVISAAVSLAALIFSGMASGSRQPGVLRLAKGFLMAGFLSSGFALLMLGISLQNHYYEYTYVWKYSSADLSVPFLVSCIWAGREGSQLLWLWMIQGCGLMLMASRSKHLPAALSVVSLVSLAFSLMLGGSWLPQGFPALNPFELLRQNSDYASSPLFGLPGYLAHITDGNGLNPLLKNPWMTLHPPVLFLGYSLTLIPYALSVSGLLSREGLPPAKEILLWGIASAALLGTGLILGGIWAYEDLTFGGFWSWDPVENASLVPWLVAVAAIHFNLLVIQRKPVGATATLLSYMPFVLVLYAAYLTRSGVLSNTSVHSFAGNTASGMYAWLALSALLIPVLIQLSRRRKKTAGPHEIPDADTLNQPEADTAFLSREFMMFAGSLTIVLSAFQILFITSAPVLNSLLSMEMTSPPDKVSFFNNWQIPFASAMVLFLGLSLMLSYRNNSPKDFLRRIIIPGTAGATALLFAAFVPGIQSPRLLILLFAAFFSIFALLDTILRLPKLRTGGPATLIHGGVLVFITGAVIAFSQGSDITQSSGPMAGMAQGNTALKGSIYPLRGGDSDAISYAGFSKSGDRYYYRLDFLRKKGDKYYLSYSLYPSLENDLNMGAVYFPDTRVFWDHDVFVYLSHASVSLSEYETAATDTLFAGRRYEISGGTLAETAKDTTSIENDEIALGFVVPGGGISETLLSTGQTKDTVQIFNPDSSVRVNLLKTGEGVFLAVCEQRKADFVIYQAKTFPGINILWAGCIMLFGGFIWSLLRRLRKRKKPSSGS